MRWNNFLEDEVFLEGFPISSMVMLLKMEMENQLDHSKTKQSKKFTGRTDLIYFAPFLLARESNFLLPYTSYYLRWLNFNSLIYCVCILSTQLLCEQPIICSSNSLFAFTEPRQWSKTEYFVQRLQLTHATRHQVLIKFPILKSTESYTSGSRSHLWVKINQICFVFMLDRLHIQFLL